MILHCIEEAGDIAGIDLTVTDSQGRIIAGNRSKKIPDQQVFREFLKSAEDERTADGYGIYRICEGDETACILVYSGGPEGYVSARLVAAQLRNLIEADRDKPDRNSFFRSLLLDSLPGVEIYNRARKLHVEAIQKRCVFIIEPVIRKDNDLTDMVRELFYTEAGDHVIAVEEGRVVVIKALSEDEGADELQETAQMLVDMAGSEAGDDVRVAYGTVADDIKDVPASFREARMALEVAGIFYPFKRTIEYANLGVGRLIYQLPTDLCRLFVKEIFGDEIPDEIDEEILTTVNRFFDNSLNVSETSRQLFIHRNTLIYRIEKLQKATGLDVRVFDDALTLKIALMVVNYMKYVEDRH